MGTGVSGKPSSTYGSSGLCLGRCRGRHVDPILAADRCAAVSSLGDTQVSSEVLRLPIRAHRDTCVLAELLALLGGLCLASSFGRRSGGDLTCLLRGTLLLLSSTLLLLSSTLALLGGCFAGLLGGALLLLSGLSGLLGGLSLLLLQGGLLLLFCSLLLLLCGLLLLLGGFF